ncbi:glycosyltransferase family 9 protein [Pontibacter cellulosilyticus]|uniref:Glycosyltransferase family 9 protein n=1 Tax=Pontibacter cellulosilyticus TaxID=1720253 RepID=A0A923N806_9BACT|nr:glycosyltransferase family 9 protein [Pontibacter cellulosilyticus]MBC5993106.1 glycosyltransferase family 9 protein [Pontibacter cellulosilyticus]
MKILILRFSSIGDIVLTTPVVRCIKEQVPEAEVHYCTKKAFQGILANNPYVDKVHVLGEKLGDLVQELKAENFDYVVDLHNNLRTRVIKARLGKPSRSFNKLNYEKWLMVNFKINRLPDVHIVQRYLEAAAPLGVKDDGKGLDYFIPAQDEVDVQTLPEGFQDGYIAFAIGAQHYTKRLPVDRIIELCEQLQKPIILLGGKEDFDTGDTVAEILRATNFDEALKVYNACGKYNLNGSASLVRQATQVVSHDTGLMHIAAAFQKDVISIWGNTIPEFGMYPYRTKYKVLEVQGLSCRPCSKIGYKKCPKGHFKCMRDISFENLEV